MVKYILKLVCSNPAKETHTSVSSSMSDINSYNTHRDRNEFTISLKDVISKYFLKSHHEDIYDELTEKIYMLYQREYHFILPVEVEYITDDKSAPNNYNIKTNVTVTDYKNKIRNSLNTLFPKISYNHYDELIKTLDNIFEQPITMSKNKITYNMIAFYPDDKINIYSLINEFYIFFKPKCYCDNISQDALDFWSSCETDQDDTANNFHNDSVNNPLESLEKFRDDIIIDMPNSKFKGHEEEWSCYIYSLYDKYGLCCRLPQNATEAMKFEKKYISSNKPSPAYIINSFSQYILADLDALFIFDKQLYLHSDGQIRFEKEKSIDNDFKKLYQNKKRLLTENEIDLHDLIYRYALYHKLTIDDYKKILSHPYYKKDKLIALWKSCLFSFDFLLEDIKRVFNQ